MVDRRHYGGDCTVELSVWSIRRYSIVADAEMETVFYNIKGKRSQAQLELQLKKAVSAILMHCRTRLSFEPLKRLPRPLHASLT